MLLFDTVWYRSQKNVLLYEAFKTGDLTALNDALYQISVMARLSNTAGTSAGRFFYAYNILPELLAANRFTEVSKVIPQVDDINGGRSAYIDLFRAVFYGAATYEEGLFPDLDNDEKFLLALLKDQPQEASVHLAEICKQDKRSRQFGETRFTRGFSVRGHAYYNLSQQVFDGAFRGLIEKPKVDNFLMALAEWQEQQDFQPGTIFQPFPEKLAFANEVMTLDLPAMHLHRPYADRGGREAVFTVLDTDRFEEEVLSLIIALKKSKEL